MDSKQFRRNLDGAQRFNDPLVLEGLSRVLEQRLLLHVYPEGPRQHALSLLWGRSDSKVSNLRTGKDQNMIRIKDASVRFDPLTPAHVQVLAALAHASVMQSVDLVVTSARRDQADDPHSRGEALDISVRDFSPRQIVSLKDDLEFFLGRAWTVLYEVPVQPSDPRLRAIAFVNVNATATHFHVQPVKGTRWPPTGDAHDPA